MALKLKAIAFVLFFGVLDLANACTYDLECSGSKVCCSGFCLDSCFSTSCTYNWECVGSDKCCDSYGDCVDCATLTVGGIVGIIIGIAVLIAIVASIVACCCCACCPWYRYRNPGTVVVARQPYQPFVSTTTVSTAQQSAVVQPPPPPAVYGQPPSYYPPPQAGAYPPPQAQGQTGYQPYPANVGQPPVKQ